ncbi:MAG: GNAT family N-acetyltransferase [Candidatus Heimdallarchaeota archaeon]|nr:GNAT family N-acetyltransferase [Candidatus Heimdallarchaeota archaeon]
MLEKKICLIKDPNNNCQISLEEFYPTQSSNEILESYLDLVEQFFSELYPEENSSYERVKHKEEILNPYELLDYYYWVISKEVNTKKTIIGMSSFFVSNKKNPDYETNKHTTWFQLFIDKQYRRQGFGTKLLEAMTHKLIDLKVVTCIQTFSFLESGWLFCEKHGAKLALTGAQNRLKLTNVDWEEMFRWVKDGEIQAKEIKCKLEVFERVPESILEKFTNFYSEISNMVPLGELDDYLKETPESRRIKEEQNEKLNIRNITMITIENDGSISGLTDILYSPLIPYIVEQEITGVLPKYRGRGLGKWLKAAMLFYIRDNLPDVTIINTGNADSNSPMLSINERMGFKKDLIEKCYKFQIDDLKKKF